MGVPVVFKGGKNYLTLVLDPEMEFSDLLGEILSKFRMSEKFFMNEPIAILFEGRKLSEKEQLQILDAIDCYTQVTISTVIENDRIKEYASNEALRRTLYPEEFEIDHFLGEAVCTYIPRSVESGEHISSENTIVVFGNVEKGAIISSDEHVIVIGALYGQAIAGQNGQTESRIYASYFYPENFRICEKLGTLKKKSKSWFGLKKRKSECKPKLAYLLDGAIQIDDYSQYI